MVSLAILPLCSFLLAYLSHAAGDTIAAYCAAALIMHVVGTAPAILNNRVTDALGKWSYSLYLCHILVRWVYLIRVPGSADGSFVVHGWFNRVAVITLSIARAGASCKFVERPFLRRPVKREAARELEAVAA